MRLRVQLCPDPIPISPGQPCQNTDATPFTTIARFRHITSKPQVAAALKGPARTELTPRWSLPSPHPDLAGDGGRAGGRGERCPRCGLVRPFGHRFTAGA